MRMLLKHTRNTLYSAPINLALEDMDELPTSKRGYCIVRNIQKSRNSSEQDISHCGLSHSTAMMLRKGSACTLCLCLTFLLHVATGGRSSGRGDAGGSSSPDSWPGHLEPLGAKAVKRAIPVLDSFPSPRTFFLDHVLASLPVVFRGGAALSPAFKTWTDQSLRLRPEAETWKVDVELKKKEDRRNPTLRISFAEFLRRYQEEDEYLVDSLPAFLRGDVLVPPPLVCDDVLSRIEDAVMWFSSGGTKSVLHNDDTDNINCLFSGQKEILFVNYTQYKNQVVLDHPEGSYSSLDVDRVDMEKYPGMRNVEFYHAKLFPGDCIYIPYKWIHQVNSFGRNIAVNVWWTHSCERAPSPETCGPTDRRPTLADISLKVEQPRGFEEDFGEDDPSPYDDFIINLKKEIEGSWTEEELVNFLKNRLPMLNDLTWEEECDVIAHEAFELLDRERNGVIDQQDLDGLPKDREDMFHFHVEAKLMMLADISHEQEAHRRMREYELERKKKKEAGQDDDEPNVLIHRVEPMDLGGVDWGTAGAKGPAETLRTNEIRENIKSADKSEL